MIAWSFNAAASGRYPLKRHDHTDFQDWRKDLCNQELAEGFADALCQARADLAELVSAFGFKNWSNKLRPCFECDCSLDDMFNFPDRMDASVWNPIDQESYDVAVRSAIKRVVVNAEPLGALKEHHKFDRRKGGFVGYALLRNLPIVGLKAGHRLVEGGDLSGIHSFKDLEAPAELIFFDCRGEHGLNFVCLLFGIEGFGMDILALNAMHILDLGVLQWLLGAILIRLIRNNFAGSIDSHAENRHQDNLTLLRTKMKEYYKTRPRMPNTYSRIESLKMSMLGTAD